MNSPEKISFSAALKLYRERRVFLGKAAELTGCGKIEFIEIPLKNLP